MKTRAELRIVACRYWNTNGAAISIVARQGFNNDFAAYIGATNSSHHTEEETHEWAAEQGCKLDEPLARFLFPQLADLVYRD